MKVCAGNRKGKYSEIWALWVSTGRVLYVFLSARHKTVGNGPAVLLQLVNCSDVEGPYSMPPMNSSLKTNSVFQVGVLGFPFLLTLLCSGVCNWRGVRWFTEIRGFLHNRKRIWHSFVMCLGTEAAKTDFPFLSLTLYQPYAKYRAVCWVSLISNQLHVQLGSLISDYGLIWDMRSEKEVGVICSGPEVMQNQSPRSPSSKRLTLQCYPDIWPDSPDTLLITGPMPHAIISTLMKVCFERLPSHYTSDYGLFIFIFIFFCHEDKCVSVISHP